MYPLYTMAETFIDIYNNIIEYEGIEITVIIDDDNIPWFNVAAITKILEYERIIQKKNFFFE
jgi:prophage antirepressor-like protein